MLSAIKQRYRQWTESYPLIFRAIRFTLACELVHVLMSLLDYVVAGDAQREQYKVYSLLVFLILLPLPTLSILITDLSFTWTLTFVESLFPKSIVPVIVMMALTAAAVFIGIIRCRKFNFKPETKPSDDESSTVQNLSDPPTISRLHGITWTTVKLSQIVDAIFLREILKLLCAAMVVVKPIFEFVLVATITVYDLGCIENFDLDDDSPSKYCLVGIIVQLSCMYYTNPMTVLSGIITGAWLYFGALEKLEITPSTCYMLKIMWAISIVWLSKYKDYVANKIEKIDSVLEQYQQRYRDDSESDAGPPHGSANGPKNTGRYFLSNDPPRYVPMASADDSTRAGKGVYSVACERIELIRRAHAMRKMRKNPVVVPKDYED